MNWVRTWSDRQRNHPLTSHNIKPTWGRWMSNTNHLVTMPSSSGEKNASWNSRECYFDTCVNSYTLPLLQPHSPTVAASCQQDCSFPCQNCCGRVQTQCAWPWNCSSTSLMGSDGIREEKLILQNSTSLKESVYNIPVSDTLGVYFRKVVQQTLFCWDGGNPEFIVSIGDLELVQSTPSMFTVG